jgi:hypothetical protein
MYVIAGGMNEQMKQNHAQNFNRQLRKRRHRLLEISCCVVSLGMWGEATHYFDVDLTLNLPAMTIVAQPFNVIKWQLNFNPVA